MDLWFTYELGAGKERAEDGTIQLYCLSFVTWRRGEGHSGLTTVHNRSGIEFDHHSRDAQNRHVA